MIFIRIKGELDEHFQEGIKINKNLRIELENLREETKKLRDKNAKLQNEIKEKVDDFNLMKEMRIRAENNSNDLIVELQECQKLINILKKKQNLTHNETKALFYNNISSKELKVRQSLFSRFVPTNRVLVNAQSSEVRESEKIKGIQTSNSSGDVQTKSLASAALEISNDLNNVSCNDSKKVVDNDNVKSEEKKEMNSAEPEIIIKSNVFNEDQLQEDAQKIIENIMSEANNDLPMDKRIKKLKMVIKIGESQLKKLKKDSIVGNSSTKLETLAQKDLSSRMSSDSDSAQNLDNPQHLQVGEQQKESLNKSKYEDDYCENEDSDDDLKIEENDNLTLKMVRPRKSKNNVFAFNDSEDETSKNPMSQEYFNKRSKRIIENLLKQQTKIKNKKEQVRPNIIYKFISELYQKVLVKYKTLFSDIDSSFRLKKPLVTY